MNTRRDDLHRSAFSLLVLAFFAATAFAQDEDVDQRVESLLAKMTLEEKLGQLTQQVTDRPEFKDAWAKGLLGSILHGGGAKEINEFHRAAMNTRLRIPLLMGFDVIHGYRTIFPIPLGIAATWDPEMAELSAQVAGREAYAGGVRWTFAPMVDIARDPRWGRIAEGAGEDPFLGSAMAAAYVRGFQSEGLLATAKHYVAYGAALAGRDYNSVDLSERTLREVYLPPFKAAVDAGVASIMSAFNDINGVPATANRHTLDQILRREWGFRGFVVSDWTAITEMINHGVASSKEDAALKAITAGVDMDMVSHSYPTLAEAVKSGRLPESVVDQSVRRVLGAKVRAGLLDNPIVEEKPVTITREHRDAARQVARKSIVLLKNEPVANVPVLPLSRQGGTIAVVGPLADAKEDMLGPWSGKGNADEVITLNAALRQVKGWKIHYAPGTGIIDGADADIAKAVEVAKLADVVIAVVGESRDMSGEAASRSSIGIPGRQEELLQAVVATRKPVVVIVMAGRPLNLTRVSEHVPAILYAWFLGTETGNALVDVLFGDTNPSGKLPVTFPRRVGQVPIFYAHLPTGRPPDEKEKYTSKYLDVPVTPHLPFGFGLSYTRFDYRNLATSAPTMKMDGRLTISAEITNAGNRAGEEVVQLYIRDEVASLSRPVKELKGFQRVALAAGETRRVEFTITREALQFWSPRGWWAEPGRFTVWIGPDSSRGLEGSFTLVP